MAKGFRPVDRDQQFLLPVNMRDWLPGDHLVWFVLDVVEALDMSAFEVRSRRGGAGRAGFDPRLLLAVLVYAYCHGQRSSRQIERLCATDVGFRILCAQDVPDHTTLARFRQGQEDALAGLFDQILVMCAQAGLGHFGVVALDGTKITANASMAANRSAGSLRELAATMIGEAAAVDAAEDAELGGARGDELDEGWSDPRGRPARIRAALAELDARREAKAAKGADADSATLARAAAQVDQLADTLDRARALIESRAVDRAQREEQAAAKGTTVAGRRPVAVEDHSWVSQPRRRLEQAQHSLATLQGQTLGAGGVEDPAVKVNLTDPQSRVMRSRHGWVQGYNAQLVATEDYLILAAHVTQDVSDIAQFIPLIDAATKAVAAINTATGRDEAIGCVLADAGYDSTTNLTAQGPDRIIASTTRRKTEAAAQADPGPPPGPDSHPRDVMRWRLTTEKGLAAYRKRGAIIEPINAHLKDRRGLRTFARRGLKAANSELRFAAAVTNLLKMHNLGLAPG